MNIHLKSIITGIAIVLIGFLFWVLNSVGFALFFLFPGMLAVFSMSPHPGPEGIPFLILLPLFFWIGTAYLFYWATNPNRKFSFLNDKKIKFPILVSIICFLSLSLLYATVFFLFGHTNFENELPSLTEFTLRFHGYFNQGLLLRFFISIGLGIVAWRLSKNCRKLIYSVFIFVGALILFGSILPLL